MKGIFVLISGLGDLPSKQLDDKTPLESANTPNMDFFATRGELGTLYPVRPQFVPESDESIVSIFGNKLISSTRGQLEAIGADIELTRGDVSFRVNFATIDSIEKGNLLDRRGGGILTTYEAEALAKAINKKIQLPVKFIFESTIQHRAVLVLRGGFSDNVSGNDLTYTKGREGSQNRVGAVKPLDEEEDSQYTANVLNEFLKKAYLVLRDHPVNVSRKERGLMPVNFLLVRRPGAEIPKLIQYRKWLSVSYMPLEIGFSRSCGMRVFSFSYPKLKKLDVYANLHNSLAKACKYASRVIWWNHKKFDYAYVHLKETDLPGHDNKPLEKKIMLETIDRVFFGFLRKFAPQKNIKILVASDHSTPCKLKEHSADPVPVLFYNGSIPREKKFSEKEARNGSLGKIVGKDLFRKVGFNK